MALVSPRACSRRTASEICRVPRFRDVTDSTCLRVAVPAAARPRVILRWYVLVAHCRTASRAAGIARERARDAAGKPVDLSSCYRPDHWMRRVVRAVAAAGLLRLQRLLPGLDRGLLFRGAAL